MLSLTRNLFSHVPCFSLCRGNPVLKPPQHLVHLYVIIVLHQHIFLIHNNTPAQPPPTNQMPCLPLPPSSIPAVRQSYKPSIYSDMHPLSGLSLLGRPLPLLYPLFPLGVLFNRLYAKPCITSISHCLGKNKCGDFFHICLSISQVDLPSFPENIDLSIRYLIS